MPSIQEISGLANELHNRKLLNLDVSARDLLALQTSVLGGKDPSIYAGWYVLGGDHYVIVCGEHGPQAQINPAAIQSAK